MCGGRGTRLGADAEKPLFEVAGRPMVDRVCDALAASRADSVYTAVSPHAPATREHVRERTDCTIIETPGEGYVADLGTVLDDDRIAEPVLTCVADLPLLAPALVDETLAAAHDRDGESLTVAVPAALKECLGVSSDTTKPHEGRTVAPVGLNVVGSAGDAVRLSYDARLAVNVNRTADASVAERLLE
nr:NTP transferase domain-containing protein [Halorientalis brevis]